MKISQIVIAQRGWVFVGEVDYNGDDVVISTGTTL